MTPTEYIVAASRTEPPAGPVIPRLQDETTVRLLHAAFGLCTETGEIQDTIKKHIFYGKPVDRDNLEEEFGDVLWYLSLLARYLGVSFETVMVRNIAKLKARFPEKFTEEEALNRDLEAESAARNAPLPVGELTRTHIDGDPWLYVTPPKTQGHLDCACWSTGVFVWVEGCEWHPWCP